MLAQLHAVQFVPDDRADVAEDVFHDCEQLSLSHYFEVGHHAHVLVFELMAVQEVQPFISVKANEDLDGFAIFEENGVLPALLPREDNPTPTGS